MAEEIRNEYPCSQKDLYSILESVWENYDEHQLDFVVHKALYTVLYGTNAKAAIATAKALPDLQARTEPAETLRVALVKKGETSRLNFRKLKSYIITAFPNEEVQKAKFEAAGQLYYSEAGNEDWESIESLNQSGSNFIAANSVALLAGANMPAGFEVAFNGDKDDFHNTYTDFKVAEQTSEQTAEKIKANNAIFKTGMDMMKDGQIIFTNDADILVKFTFQTLWDLINPPVAGVKGNAKLASDNLPVPGARITAQREGEPVEETETDESGNYSLRLAAGTYRVTVEMPGFVTQSVEVVVETGSYRTVNFVLVAG